MSIGTHQATLNLFREPDGTYEITVASADMAVMAEATRRGVKPIDYVEGLIMMAADRMKARHRERAGPTPAQIDHRCRLAARAGAKARREGKPITANDRPRGTIFYDCWADAWQEEME